MNTMKYKDYCARIEFSDEDQCFVGRVVGIRDVVGFHGDSVDGRSLNAWAQDALQKAAET